METLLSVMNTLHVDKSFFTQFFIVGFFLYVSRLVFLKTLLDVILLRNKKTSGAEVDLTKMTHETEALQKRYNKVLMEKVIEINTEYAEQRRKVSEENDHEYKAKEEKIYSKYRTDLDVKVKEISELKNKITPYIKELSEELVAKFK